MVNRSFFKLVCLAAAVPLAISCSRIEAVDTASTGLSGTLFICGGAMKRDNVVWQRMAELSGEKGIAVIPTASGVPEESGPGSAELFQPFGHPTRVINVTTENPEAANDLALADEVRNSGGVFFTGGDQRRLTSTYIREDGTRTPVMEAIWEVLDRGGVIGGTSAGAACQSDPMINGGISADSLREGPDMEGNRGVGWEPGLGFFPWGLVDQHHIYRGRVGRLLVALDETDIRFGYGIDENAALEVDRATATGRVVSGLVLMLDTEGMSGGVGQGYRDVTFRILQAGDKIDFLSGDVSPASTRTPLAADSTHQTTAEDIWARGEMEKALLSALAVDSPRQIIDMSDPSFRMTITADSLAAGPGDTIASLIEGTMDIQILTAGTD